MLKLFKTISAVSALALMTACGGGGGGGAAATSGTAEGYWIGNASTGYRVALAVLENGETWGVYTSNGTIYGAIYGTSNGTGNTFSATGSDFNLVNWSVVNGSMTGTVVPKSTINAVGTTGTTVSLTYSTTYDSAALLSTIAGSYVVNGVSASGTATNVPMTIDANGVVSVVGNGCTAAGTVLPRSSGKNIYNINVTFTGNNCALGNGGTASGIFALDRTVTPNIAITLALTPNKQDGFIAVGEKQ
jgi:hypothetical protein